MRPMRTKRGMTGVPTASLAGGATRPVVGAMALGLVSKAVGLGREVAVVTLLGVQDYTDSYFATSAVILWVQNWAFGALSLSLVPRMLREHPSKRLALTTKQTRVAAAIGSLAGVALFGVFSSVEKLLLDGRAVLGPAEAACLAGAIPAIAVGGVHYSRVISTPGGILRGAGALLTGNSVGIILLAGAMALGMSRPLVLPAVLLGSQIATTIALYRLRAEAEAPSFAGGPGGLARGIAATTVENIGFNVNAVIHQGLAGRLGPGAVSVNAYVMRLVLVPLTGLLGPIQQRLMQKYAAATRESGAVLAIRVGVFGLIGGVAAALLVLGAWLACRGFLPAHFREAEIGWVALGYAVYAGVLFCNQSLARWFFSQGTGWVYTGVLLGAYVSSAALKVALLEPLGMMALPAGAILAEGLAAGVMLSLLWKAVAKPGSTARRSPSA